MIEFFNPSDAPAPGAFSRATRAAGLVFVSGTGAGNDIGGTAREGTAAEQTRWALKNVEKILLAAGSSLDRVVQVTLLIQERHLHHPVERRARGEENLLHVLQGPARLLGGRAFARRAADVVARAGARDKDEPGRARRAREGAGGGR